MENVIHEIGKKDIRKAQEIAWEALGEHGRKNFFEFRDRQSCIRQAQSVPLPGASKDAFTKSQIRVGERRINPVVPAHFAVLQALDSPLLKLIADATANKSAELTNPTQEQKWEICHVFTADAKTLFKTLKSKGVDFIREQAADAVGMEWQAAEVELAMPAIMEQLKRHIETTVRFAGEMEKEGDVRFFREQPEKP